MCKRTLNADFLNATVSRATTIFEPGNYDAISKIELLQN